MADHIRYDILVQEALRGMVKGVLTDAAKKGLPGEHHFFITFDTTAEGVRISSRLREQYPEEMTIVLQHQFWDLKISDKAFEVGLSFGGVAERLYIPFDALKGFADPSVQFGLQFEELGETEDDQPAAATEPAPPPPAKKKPAARTPAAQSRSSVPASPAPTPIPAPAADASDASPEPPGDKSGAEVVRLDRFRKK